ncbi:MAG: ABC transporter permease, partial [Myxococcaceae bacterium]
MRNALAITRKELGIYFTTPWAYAVFTAMMAVTAFFFIANLTMFRQINEAARAIGWNRMPGDFQAMKNLTDGVAVPLWGVMLIITLFVAPFLSMRLFAEEKRHKTFELLMT